MLVGILIGLILLVLVGWAIERTGGGIRERIQKKEWWRLWIAGIALLVPVIYALVFGVK